jgi:hypothetical protein
LKNGELQNLYSSPDVIRQNNQGEGGRQGMWHAWGKSVQGFGGKARRKETIRKTDTSMEKRMKMDLREIDREGVERIHFTSR